MITLNNFLKHDIDVSGLPNKLKTAYNFTVKYIEIYGTSKVIDDAIKKSIRGLNKHINETSKPKQQTLTNPIDIFIHKAGSAFRGIPTSEIKTLLTAINRLKKDKEDWKQYSEDGDLGIFQFTEKEESELGIPENYNSKNQPKTSLLTSDNYFGELKLSETGETILAAYEKFASKKTNLKPITTGQLMLFGIDDVNERFNKELDLLIQGKLPKNHILNLGMPSNALLSVGIPNLPIELSSSRLLSKSIQSEHPFDLSIVKNLPNLISKPLIVFTSATELNSFVVVVEITHKGKNFVIPIRINWTNGEKTVNSVRSVHYRMSNMHIVNWINERLHVWVNKKNTLNWLSKQRYNSADVKQLIKSATNIIQNFNNPTPTPNNLNEENNNLFGLQPLGSTKKGKTYRLRGHLGQFLGEYDRNNYTVVVRGDKGAGKSRLLYQLINAFAGKQLRIAFLSLEMSLNSSITERYKKEYISKPNLKRIDITDLAPTYEDLNAICKKYDVVAIDSWTKLRDITQGDFDKLQKENPGTIIICIFQSTTGKITRGGNMPEYDAGMVIQVNDGGLAECEKNRYAPTDKIYNVFSMKIEETINV